MEYRQLGKSGLKVSELSFGSWLTFGAQLDQERAKECMRRAFTYGVNFFDNAEAYGGGASEYLMGEVLKEYRREDLVISTKIFWGGNGPNDTGLSRKHLMEGTRNSLKRLQLEYVDLLYCHRPDQATPIEETVRAMDQIIRSGQAFYWGTSEWSAKEIEEAYKIAKEIGAIPPTMEQPQYNLLKRERVEEEYAPLYERYGLGTTIWSPLASGLLTGKYNNGIPKGSRLERFPQFGMPITNERIAALKKFKVIADGLGCSMAQLALAWCLKKPHVSSVITGATTANQVDENMQALKVKEQLDDVLLLKIESLFS